MSGRKNKILKLKMKEIICHPLKCKEYFRFLEAGEACPIKHGGGKCSRYDEFVGKYDDCIAYSISEEEVLEVKKTWDVKTN